MGKVLLAMGVGAVIFFAVAGALVMRFPHPASYYVGERAAK